MTDNETVYVIPQPEALLVVEEVNDIVEVTTPGPQGPPGPPGPMTVTFGMSGPVSIGIGAVRWYNLFGVPRTIQVVAATVGLSPVGEPVVVDVNVDGTTIFPVQGDRPSIAPGAHVSQVTPDFTAVQPGSYITADVDNVGSTSPGEHLYIQVYLA